MSKLDQENLRLKIKKWKKGSESSSHYFRPYIRKDKTPLTSTTRVCNNVKEDEKGTTEECIHTLLWVHQNDWQKELLVKYGNAITLIDCNV